MFINVVLFICFVPFVVGQISQLESDCHILQTLDDLQNRMTSWEARSDTEIANLKESSIIATTAITNLKESVTSAEKRINEQNTEIATLREALNTAERQIENLKAPYTGTNGTDCPDTWTAFQGSCYLSQSVAYTFQGAETACQDLGGRLVHIETVEENSFVKSFISCCAGVHWIGLEDGEVEGLWKWHGTDTIPAFTDWDRYEPNGGTDANCAIISATPIWMDTSCTNRYRPLCERPRQ